MAKDPAGYEVDGAETGGAAVSASSTLKIRGRRPHPAGLSRFDYEQSRYWPSPSPATNRLAKRLRE